MLERVTGDNKLILLPAVIFTLQFCDNIFKFDVGKERMVEFAGLRAQLAFNPFEILEPFLGFYFPGLETVLVNKQKYHDQSDEKGQHKKQVDTG